MPKRQELALPTTGCFLGTGEAYAEFRPDYPDEIIAYIAHTFGLNRTQDVIDIGCGTGLLSFPLSHHVKQIVAVDKEQGMLNTAKILTTQRNIKNTRFINMAGEDVTEAIGSFHLAVFGNSFHWLNRERVLSNLQPMLRKDGGIAILTAFYIWHGNEPWKQIVRELITEYTGEDRTQGINSSHNALSHADILAQSGFVNIHVKDFSEKYMYSLPSLLGFLDSTSYASRNRLGDKAGDFRDTLTKRLAQQFGSAHFEENIEYQLVTAKKADKS